MFSVRGLIIKMKVINVCLICVLVLSCLKLYKVTNFERVDAGYQDQEKNLTLW